MDTHLNAADDGGSTERWLAYELHDGLLQWLVSARMGVESALPLVEPDQPTLRTRLEASLTVLTAAAEEGRELIGFIESQSASMEQAFEERLASFIERIDTEASTHGQNITLNFLPSQQTWSDLPPRTSWNLLRVAQQAVRNAVLHAGPCEISVVCGHDSSTAFVEICDDGHGFDSAEVSEATDHYGLASMRHRAKLIGAQFDLTSQVGCGTRVRVAVQSVNP